LGTTASVAVTDTDALPRAQRLLEQEVGRIDRACSRFRQDSEIARANAAAGREVAVSQLFADALEVALRAAHDTDGIVDPTLGTHLRAAGYDRTFTLVAARGGWTFVPQAVREGAWRQVELDVERCLVRVPRGVELDLGATAKAFAADRAAQAIAAATGAGAIVSLGGDVAIAGPAPSGGWCVAIADDHRAPLDNSEPRVLIATGGLATSSTSVRSWPTSLGPAHHVLDPATGLPASTPWRTVTVAAGSCVDANVASTAAIVLGSSAPGWLDDLGLPARLAAGDGSVVSVCGWPADEEAAA